MTQEQVEAVLAAKAAKQNLTVEQLTLLCELSEDCSNHAGVEALGYARTEFGSCLTLFSASARYQVMLVTQPEFRVIETGKQSNRLGEAHRNGNGHPSRLSKPGKTVLKCYRESFDTCQTELIHESESEDIAAWENLRAKILFWEGYESWRVGDSPKREDKIEVSA
jgi:hypothetical protein